MLTGDSAAAAAPIAQQGGITEIEAGLDPAGKFLFFQLLDASGQMIQSMRSGTTLQPGETAGCTGCHEARDGSAPAVPRGGRPAPWRRCRPCTYRSSMTAESPGEVSCKGGVLSAGDDTPAFPL